MRYYTVLSGMLWMLFSVCSGYGQCDQIPDFKVGTLSSNGGAVPGSLISGDEIYAGYGFQMVYDSTGMTMFKVSNVEMGGQRVKLATWCSGKNIVGHTNAELSDSSVTENMVLVAGDTIAFYRELGWANLFTDEQTVNFYYAKDTLDFVVELVSVGGGRLALLDSIGVLRNDVPSVPVVYGHVPVIRMVKYVVPSWLGDSVGFLRVRLYSRGDGEHYFNRLDRWAVAMERRLTDSLYVSFWQSLSALKMVSESERMLEQSKMLEGFKVQSNVSGGAVKVYFPLSETSSTSVVVFDEMGRKVLVPAYVMGGSSGEVRSIDLSIESSGVYFVCLFEGNVLVGVERIVVQ